MKKIKKYVKSSGGKKIVKIRETNGYVHYERPCNQNTHNVMRNIEMYKKHLNGWTYVKIAKYYNISSPRVRVLVLRVGRIIERMKKMNNKN